MIKVPSNEPELDDQPTEASDEDDDFGEPFVARSFGGELVWADGDHYTCKILRVRAGQQVIVSTKNRVDMFAMLTGGRGLLEVRDLDGEELEQLELLPATPVQIADDRSYRLVAITEVEMFVAYSPAPPAPPVEG